MDMMAMVSSMLAMQAAGTQQQIQTSIIKQNNDAEKSAVKTLRRQSPSTAQPQVAALNGSPKLP